MHHHGDDPLTSVIVCNHGLHRSHGVALATQEILNHLTDPNDCGRMFNVQLFQISKAGHYKKDYDKLKAASVGYTKPIMIGLRSDSAGNWEWTDGSPVDLTCRSQQSQLNIATRPQSR